MMTREQRAGLARLMLRWPEGRAALRLKGASDLMMLELCAGYERACDAATYWSKSNSPGAISIADEYRDIDSKSEVEFRERANMASLTTATLYIERSLPKAVFVTLLLKPAPLRVP